jgi:GWxTD domain-containing protein
MQKSRFFLFFYLLLLLFFITNQQKNNRLYAQDKEKIDSLFNLAELYFNDNNFDSAKICYKNVLDIDGKNVKALLGLAKNGYQCMDILDTISNKNYNYAKKAESMKTNYNRINLSDAAGYIEEALKLDRNNIEANYISGILFREKMRLRLSFSKGSSFESGTTNFQKVIKLDSMYKDVYIQYAMLLRFYDKYAEALDTCMKGIELKKDYSPAYTAYLRIATDFFKEANEEEVHKYLDVENDIFRQYLSGEYERTKGHDLDAIKIFNNLIMNYDLIPQHYTNSGFFPITLVYSSVLKIYAKENDIQKLNETFWIAVNRIKNETEADIIFNDLKYLASTTELLRYFGMNYEEKKEKFFYSFWNKRHPETNMNYSGRLAEHYKRLVNIEKEYYSTRERVLFKKPVNSYEYNFEFTDQGLIYIKYGEPDKISKTSSYSDDLRNPGYTEWKFSGFDGSPGQDPHKLAYDTTSATLWGALARTIDSSSYTGPINESWLYNESPFNIKMIFSFIGMEKKLTTNFFDKEILEDLKHWDKDIFRYTVSNNPTDEDEALQKIVKNGQEKLAIGVTSERSSIRTSTKEIILPNEIYKMKGPNGKTHLEIAYFLPYRTLLEEIPSDIDTLNIESGYMILDKDWNITTAKLDTLVVARSDRKKYSQIKFLFIDVDPDSSEINLFFNPLNSNISCFYKNRSIIENYSSSGLKLSDIVIASKLEKSDKKGFFTRNGMDVVPSPTSKYPLDKLLNIYYEIYGLKKNSEGKTLYNVEYAFRYSGQDENLLKKIFNSSDGQTTSSEYSKSGKETSSNEYISFGLSKLNSGTYDLEITIKDINAQKTIKKKKRIELYD